MKPAKGGAVESREDEAWLAFLRMLAEDWRAIQARREAREAS